MKVSVIGLANTGKTTIFNALTGQSVETAPYPATSGDPHIGVVKVPDPRIDKISGIFKQKKLHTLRLNMWIISGSQKAI